MKPRPIVKLRASLERRLTAYAITAGASGIGLLLWPQPAAARIVYTKADVQLQLNFPLLLDLNRDGVVDFSLNLTRSSYGDLNITAVGKGDNRVAGYCRHLSQSCWASAQPPDVRVGPNQRFGPYSLMLFAFCSTTCFGRGAWDNVQNRYLGFEFSINGKLHYGWGRLSVSLGNEVDAVLTGYAYETVPHKPLITGKTKGSGDLVPESGTLGRLARGASAVRE